MSKTKKLTPSTVFKHRLFIPGLILISALVYGGWQLYRSFAQPTDIFFIDESNSKIACSDSLNRFVVSNSCGYQKFRTMSYRCNNKTQVVTRGYGNKTDRANNRDVCKSYNQWYKEAEQACNIPCTPPSTPTARPSSTPTASGKPAPSCIPAPKECVDDKTGAFTLCDPAPGVVWCQPQPPAGCWYEDVQCFKEPCPKILTCNY